jgi:alpha-beta hydrolase superfamily lysophospholipase
MTTSYTHQATLKLRSSYDDLDISILTVVPNDAPKAVIQIAHGVCGYKEKFLPFMEYMATHGVACIANDHRGHGESIKSPEDLGYMYSGGYLALVEDLKMVNAWAHRQFPDTPIYLLGHSMGSMASRVFAKQDDSTIDGLILCGSPSWNPMAWIGYIMASLACAIGLSHSRMTAVQRMTSNTNNRKFASEGYQAWVCSDRTEREKAQANPLSNFFLTANGSQNLMALTIDTYRKGRWAMKNPHMFVHFISGDDDPMIINEKRFHSSVQNLCNRGYTNVTSALYPGMRHEVLNEIGKEEVWEEILLKCLG